MNKYIIRAVAAISMFPLTACATSQEAQVASPEQAASAETVNEPVKAPCVKVLRVVPESYVSKAWTVYLDGDEEMRVTFWRPDVFRIERGLKVADTNIVTKTEITSTGQYITTTNNAYTVAYEDKLNDPKATQMILDEVIEDSSRVRFFDSQDRYTWKTSALTLVLDKENGVYTCFLADGKEVWREAAPVEIKKAATTNEVDNTTLRLASNAKANYFGGGQQNGSFIHTGKAIDIVADCNWAEGGHPNPAPWAMARVDKGVYYGILRHTFSPGKYDFSKEDVASFTHNESRFDAFFFVGKSFNEIIDRYSEFTGRPNFIPVWGLELGDADAWMTRDKQTREPEQKADLSYTETTCDVVERNAEKYRAENMPGGWLLVNDGYGCKYMQLAWVVEALKGLGFHTGLWTEGALDRIKWEIGTAGTRVQKIDVAWSGPAYQHGLNCNKVAYDGFIENSNARAFIWTCQGWAGTQRYAVCWTGDQYGNFDLIRYHIPTLTGSGMSAQAYATTDIDGIFGGSNESYLRDLEWKCFTPALYVMNGWSNINKAPWSYPEPYKTHIREWLKLKLRLTPYMYTTCREAWETGAPIVRALAWNYPDDPNALSDKVNYEMMLGRDFLVAPVYESQEDSSGWYLRGIYLPEGDWYDYFDGRRVKGGATIGAYQVQLWNIPVFVRAGAIIPMYPETLYSTQVPKDTLTFDIYPGGESSYTVYEDDGESRDYEKGEFTRQTIKVVAPNADETGDIDIALEGVVGKGYKGQILKRAYEFLVHTEVAPERVLVDGEELIGIVSTGKVAAAIYKNSPNCWYFDPNDRRGIVKIKLDKRCAKEAVNVKIVSASGVKAPSPAYPTPPKEVLEKSAKKAQVQTKLIAPMNSPDLVQKIGQSYTIEVDGTWKRVSGSVVCANNTNPNARVTFRLTDDKGNVIFERVGQKGNDAPQICEVNIPSEAKTITFTFSQEGEIDAWGVWKQIKLVK